MTTNYQYQELIKIATNHIEGKDYERFMENLIGNQLTKRPGTNGRQKDILLYLFKEGLLENGQVKELTTRKVQEATDIPMRTVSRFLKKIQDNDKGTDYIKAYSKTTNIINKVGRGGNSKINKITIVATETLYSTLENMGLKGLNRPSKEKLEEFHKLAENEAYTKSIIQEPIIEDIPVKETVIEKDFNGDIIDINTTVLGNVEAASNEMKRTEKVIERMNMSEEEEFELDSKEYLNSVEELSNDDIKEVEVEEVSNDDVQEVSLEKENKIKVSANTNSIKPKLLEIDRTKEIPDNIRDLGILIDSIKRGISRGSYGSIGTPSRKEAIAYKKELEAKKDEMIKAKSNKEQKEVVEEVSNDDIKEEVVEKIDEKFEDFLNRLNNSNELILDKTCLCDNKYAEAKTDKLINMCCKTINKYAQDEYKNNDTIDEFYRLIINDLINKTSIDEEWNYNINDESLLDLFNQAYNDEEKSKNDELEEDITL